jgi:sugar lactone lactonase YvrE
MNLLIIFSIIICVLGVLYPGLSYPSGIITHIGQAQEILNRAGKGDSSIPSNIREVILKNPKAFKGGALDGDIFNFLATARDKNLPRKAHQSCSSNIAIQLMNRARNDVERAYAYGWALVHLPGDIAGHDLVNEIVGQPWNYDIGSFSGTNGFHIEMERQFDRFTLDGYGFNQFYDENGRFHNEPNLDLDISIPTSFLRDALGQAYGEAGDLSWVNLALAETLIQGALYGRASTLANIDYPENQGLKAEFDSNYSESINEIGKWMREPSKVNTNYNIDTGREQPSLCDRCSLKTMSRDLALMPHAERLADEYCSPPQLKPLGPGSDHPDDKFDVSTSSPSDNALIEDWVRLGIKKGLSSVLFFWNLRTKLEEIRSLSPETDPVVKARMIWKMNEVFSAHVNNPDVPEAFVESNPQMLEEIAWVEDVAVLDNGYSDEMVGLSGKLREPMVKIPVDFTLDSLKGKTVLVIPSGGFYGLKDSQIIKELIAEYVKSGGSLVVFAQQHGNDFSILPVPEEADGNFRTVTGYGWAEDQACSANSVYIENYHQILSGQNRGTPSINVDGYFTSYPSNAAVLLRRTANGQPALLTYDYGQGKVILSSMYSDFAYSQAQASSEEITLIRDMIVWAKKPDKLTQIKPGETVAVTVSVSNYTDTNATSVKLSFLDPSRKVTSEQTLSLSIAAGQSASIPVSFNSIPTSALGIYHIDYALLDAQGNVIQPQAETDSGRFVVSNPPTGKRPDKAIWFSVSTSSQEVPMGAPFDYTFHIFNNTDEIRNLTITTYLRHTFRRHEWNVVANARSETTISGSDPFIDYYYKFETMEALLYDESGKVIGRYELSFKALMPSADVSFQADKKYYGRSQPVTLQVSLKNRNPFSWQADFKMVVLDGEYRKVWEEVRSVPLASNGTGAITASMTLPADASAGTYSIRGELFSGVGLVSSTWVTIEIRQSQVSVTPTLPSVLVSNANSIPFTLVNLGKIPVTLGALDVTLLDPEGGLVSSRGQPFALAVGESKTIEFHISIPSLKFGNYTLSYSQSDETRTGSPTVLNIPNTLAIVLSLDKPSYRVRETAILSAELKNTGRFNFENLSVLVSAADAGFLESKSISLGIGKALPLPFSIPIPETVASGQHDLNVTLAFPSGGSAVYSTKFAIPESSLVLGYSGPTPVSAGGTVSVTVENTGGVDTSYTSQKLMLVSGSGKIFYDENVSGSVLSGERKTLIEIPVPSQAAGGTASLRVQLKDDNTGKIASFYQPLGVAGLTAALQSQTDKEAYLKAEPVTALAHAANGPLGIEGGILKIAVGRMDPSIKGRFLHFLPKKGWAGLSNPTGVAVGPDGSVYVTDTWNHRVQKFDPHGNLVTRWGRHGSEKGEFIWPEEIAVGPDGSVYVAEIGSSRIQRFDGNGKFITQWVCRDNEGKYFLSPDGLAAGGDGSVYIAGNYAWGEYDEILISYVLKFDGSGNLIAQWGRYGSGDGEFQLPHGIAAGPDGSIYVADTGNYRIQKFDGNGNFITKWGRQGSGDGEFGWLEGIAAGADGFVYVTENNRIQKFDSNGNFIAHWGQQGSKEGEFDWLEGIAVAVDGSVYVADGGNDRVQKFDNQGIFITKWGSRADGEGQFNGPADTAVGADGSIYVADSGNHRIQKFDENGDFITQWQGIRDGYGEIGSPESIDVGPDVGLHIILT